jgi:uncharacterized protein (DUF433 family)
MAQKSAPFSMRLSRGIYEYVTAEARRSRRSKGAIVESLADEAMRVRRFPGLAFRGPEPRRPWVIGTALDVWQIIEASRDFASPEEMVARTDLAEDQVRLALAYYNEYPDEVDEAIRDNQRPLEEWQREFPWIETIVVDVD